MIPRQLEPEVMDTREEAVNYDTMDHSEVNRLFAESLLPVIAGCQHHQMQTLKILDLGTGTALIPIEICQRIPHLQIIAADLAAEMLKVAQQNIQRAGLSESIFLEHADAKQLPCENHSFDGVISNSLIHHIPEPQTVFAEIKRVLKPGGFLFLRDLLRPDSQAELNRLVTLYAADENPQQRQMFHDSLHAALTREEVRALLHSCHWPEAAVNITSDRHWTVSLNL
ncbi:class I SAM-dependent methyltransferase [Gimesia sp.]|uniref:class I SAM-dependent methyltransferase n=1 Tax=Gimesia sp. TaxID=2024833 RepID=UPI003A9207A0